MVEVVKIPRNVLPDEISKRETTISKYP